MSIVFEITDINTLNEVMNSEYEIVIIDIYADWCQPCKYLAPKLEELAKQYLSPKIIFCKLNSETGLKQGLRGLPTVEFWVRAENGSKQLFDSVVGADLNKIKEVLQKLVSVPVQQQHQNSSAAANFKNKNMENKGGQYKTWGTYN